jgi:type I site-specific restriction-modification system R (restriction) subunit
MKKSIMMVSAFVFMAVIALTNCDRRSKKVDDAQAKMDSINTKAKEEYLTDIENYRRDINDMIAANDRTIEEFRAKMKKQKREINADYKKKITQLEQKNNELKKRMDEYKAEGKENWDKFKAEFDHDMAELGKAFKDLTVKNVK